MQEVLIIRFGALGDLCLLGWTLARLAAGPARAGLRVTLVTKQRLADLAVLISGVDQVVALREPGGLCELMRLAGALRRREETLVIDAHSTLRSRLLLALMGRRPDAVLRKDTAARLRLLGGGARIDRALRRHMRDRFDALLDEAGLPANRPSPGIEPPLAHLIETGRATGPAATRADPPDRAWPPVLGIAPGAQWDAKRWPASHWAELVRRYRALGPSPLRVFLGPRERTWFAGSELDRVLGEASAGAGHRARGIELVQDRPLPEVAALLAECRLLVCNDSGLLHLAEAVGTPVVAFFGPTVAAFGYTPILPASEVFEVDGLDCRPCSRNGKRPCRRKDLACLDRIEPDRVWQAVSARGPWHRE